MTLEEMRSVDVRTVNPSTLHDRRDVRIDSRQPKQKRIASYLRQIGNPYCYVDGGVVVKIGFTETKETIVPENKIPATENISDVMSIKSNPVVAA